MSRDLKFHHRSRLLNNRRKYWSGHATSKVLNTPVTCSCFMCGNPRKLHKKKLTLQELKALDRMQEHDF